MFNNENSSLGSKNFFLFKNIKRTKLAQKSQFFLFKNIKRTKGDPSGILKFNAHSVENIFKKNRSHFDRIEKTRSHYISRVLFHKAPTKNWNAWNSSSSQNFKYLSTNISQLLWKLLSIIPIAIGARSNLFHEEVLHTKNEDEMTCQDV